MKIKEIAFVCYAVSNLPKGRNFYEKVLGLVPDSVFEQGDMGFVEYQIGATTLAIGSGAPNFKPGAEGPTVAFEVDDFEAAIKSLKAAKVKFILEGQDTTVCHMALVEDPDGNIIMIHKRKDKK